MKLISTKTFQAFLLFHALPSLTECVATSDVVHMTTDGKNDGIDIAQHQVVHHDHRQSPMEVERVVRMLQDEGDEGDEDGEDGVDTEVEPESEEESESADSLRSLEIPKERDCKISQKKDKVEFECKSKTENDMTETEIKDKIEFKVSAKKDGLKVKVEYETEVETATEETETETGYELVFDRIIEYRKIGGDDMSMTTTNTTTNTTTVLFEDDAYEWDVDEVVQEWPLDDFDDFSSVTEEGNLNKFSVATKDGIATFFFTIARADTADITANKMKIDFELLDFPWNSTDTHVALVCDVETTQKVEVEYEDEDDDEEDDEDNDADRKLLRQLKKSDEEKEKKKKAPKDIKISFDDAANAVGFVPFGSYTWRKEALAEVPADSVAISRQSGGDDGEVAAGGDRMFQTINVVATTSPAEDSTMLAFSFVGDGAQLAPDIYWDPEAGVGYEEAAAAGGGSKSGGVSSTTMMMSTDMIGMLAGGMITAVMLASVWM